MSDEEMQESVQVTEEIAPNNGGTSEKMLSQSEVNALVGRTRNEAAERARRQVEQEYQAKMKELESQRAQNPEQKGEIDEERLYQQIQERMHQEMQQRQFENEMKQVADAYTSKMATGNERYQDFEQVMGEFDPTAFPQLVYLVSGLDNAADIMYELQKNPSKLSAVDYLAHRDPKKAKAELTRIGQSISANQEALSEAEQARTNSPLDRLQPSRVSGSNDQLSIRDLRSQSWLRG